MLVAASTDCFGDEPLVDAIGRLNDLEYSNVEIVIRSGGGQLTPAEVAADLESVVAKCRDTHRLNIVSYHVDMSPAEEHYYDYFSAICRLAKATKVVTLSIPSGELGTPFNEEVERLRKLVDLAAVEGARVGIRSQTGCLSEDPDTVVVLCDNVKGLGVSLDPSHYICNPAGPRNYDKLMKYVYHVLLRDTRRDQLQVRVGQGEVEYGRLVSLLRKVDYNRALSVHITEMDGVDHMAELRKIRLLLESLL